MSCSKTASSNFLSKITPLYRFLPISSFSVTSKFVPEKNSSKEENEEQNNSTTIEFGTDEWKKAMCLFYRNLLVLHRQHIKHPLQRDFGDRFLQAEFRRGAKLSSRKHALIFYQQWLDYGLQVEQGAASQGRSLSTEQQDMMNEDQKEGLEKFRSLVFDLRQQEGLGVDESSRGF